MKIFQDIRAIARPSQICALLPLYSGDDEETFRLGRLGRWYGRLVALAILISSLAFGEDVLYASREYRLVASAQGTRRRSTGPSRRFSASSAIR